MQPVVAPPGRSRFYSSPHTGRVLRLLRAGFLITFIVSVGLSVSRHEPVPGAALVIACLAALYIGGLLVPWLTAALLWSGGRARQWALRAQASGHYLDGFLIGALWLPVIVILTWLIGGSGGLVILWREVLRASGINIGSILSLSPAAFSLGLLACLDLALRTYRVCGNEPAAGSPRPVHRVMRMPVVGLTALVLIPPLALIAVIVPGLRYEPVTQSTAAGIKTDGLPSRPTSLSPDDVWHQDFENLLDVTSGAAGPVVLAEEGVVGLDPADGTRRWSYHRQDATYLSVPEASGIALYGVDYLRPPQSQYLITSPDERYIALRVDGPGRVMPQTPPCVTIVLDAVTGEVVSEHLSDGGPLQLTDSAVLDGTIAYELDKGAKLWDLKAIGIKAESIRYSGTAGHSSFVLGFTHESDSDTGFSHGMLTLAPQDAPSQQRQSPPLMLEVDQEHLVVIAGWTVAIKGGGPSDLSGSPTEGWQAQALSVDAMAGVAGADTHAHDLGAGYGIGDAASRSSGRLALLSSSTPWQGSYAGYSPSQEWCAATTVSAVFDPRSRTVTGASDTPGLAAGAVGLSHGQPDDAEGDHVVIRPGGGASQITFPP